jgi:radical SAM superfamily enzyme YgiQ (UPF0313 family)
MRFLLVVPRFAPAGSHYEFPLGLAYVSAALKAAGHQVSCLNLNHSNEPVPALVAEAITRHSPEVCATGGLSPHHAAVNDILRAARAVNSDIVNLVGGGVMSADPALAFRLLDVDVGVIGEGEVTTVEWAAAMGGGRSLNEVPGLAYRDHANGDLVRTTPRPAIRDLDSLPWPDYEGFGLEAYFANQFTVDDGLFHFHDRPRALPVISSRSCPYGCTFCFHPIGRVYRERSLDGFFAELDHLVAKHRINTLAILDELFVVKKERLNAFCERIKPYGMKWMVQLHVASIDAAVLSRMRNAGCVHVSIGVESMDEGILKSMRKKTTPRQVETALAQVHAAHVGILGNLIFGDPAETEESINRSMDWWARNRQYRVAVSFLQVYPGSPIYRRAVEEGRIEREPSGMPSMTTNLTAIPDGRLADIRQRLLVYRETLTLPASVKVFEPTGETTLRGPTFRVTWTCPRCAHNNDYQRVTTTNFHHSQVIDLSCRSCMMRFDIEPRSRNRRHDPEKAALLAEARAFRESRRIAEATRLLSVIVGADYPGLYGDRPVEFATASLDLGLLLLEHNGPPAKISLHIGNALRMRVFDPHLHLFYALALANEGIGGGARLHRNQALTLGRENMLPLRPLVARVTRTISALDPSAAGRYV